MSTISYFSETVQKYVSAPIVIIDTEGEKHLHEKKIPFVTLCGGFATTRMTWSNEEGFREFLEGHVDERTDEKYVDMANRTADVILVSTWAFDHLSEDDITALVLHEFCHVIHGDHLVDQQKVMGIGINLNHEMRADTYASMIVGAPAVANAIRNTIKARIASRKKWLTKMLFSLDLLPFVNKPMKSRLQALTT